MKEIYNNNNNNNKIDFTPHFNRSFLFGFPKSPNCDEYDMSSYIFKQINKKRDIMYLSEIVKKIRQKYRSGKC